MESLQTYLSSEDEDEPIVKRCKHFKENSSDNNIRQPRIPLPSPFLPSFKREETKEKAHEGRVRSFEHERGNWASFVSVNYDYDLTEVISRVLERCTQTNKHTNDHTNKHTNDHTLKRISNSTIKETKILTSENIKRSLNKKSSTQTEVKIVTKGQRDIERYIKEGGVEWKGVVDDWHVSLSRTVVVLHHWMDLLLLELKKNLNGCSKCTLHLGKLEAYSNDERTRTFIGLKVEENDTLLSYMRAVNESLQAFDLPIYYKNASFHVSVMWALGDVREMLGGVLEEVQDVFDGYFKENPHMAFIHVQQITLKMGNKVYQLRL